VPLPSISAPNKNKNQKPKTKKNNKKKKQNLLGSMLLTSTLAKNARVYKTQLRPAVSRMDEKGGMFARTESLGVLTTDAAGGVPTAIGYRINPGLKWIFPDGESIANKYDKYHCEALRFRYVPASGNNHSGSVRFGFDVDPNDSAAPDKKQIAIMPVSKQGPIRDLLVATIPKKMMGGTKRVRCGVVPSALTGYDVGIFWIIFDSLQPSFDIGELFVDYHFTYAFPTPSGITPSPRQCVICSHPSNKDLLPIVAGLGYDPRPVNINVVNNTAEAVDTVADQVGLRCGYYLVHYTMPMAVNNTGGVTSDNIQLRYSLDGVIKWEHQWLSVSDVAGDQTLTGAFSFSVSSTDAGILTCDMYTAETVVNFSTNTIISGGSIFKGGKLIITCL